MRVRAIISATCMLSLLMAVHPALAVRAAGYQVCNKTSEKLSVAIAYYSRDKDFFVSEGWWNLTPGGCARVFTNRPSYDLHRYYYAHNGDKSTTWVDESGPEVCIDPHYKFTLGHADSTSECPRPYVRQKFHFFSDNDLNLLPSGTPAAGGQQSGPANPGSGACLRVANDRNYNVSFAVDGFPGVHWESEAMDVLGLGEGVLTYNGAPIKSSTGRFSIRGYGGSDVSNATWKFDPNDTLHGCNGTWTVTFK